MKEYQGDLSQLKLFNIPLENKYNIVMDILHGLYVIHSNNFVHSDIKPTNILYEYDKNNERYRAYITDFGVSRKNNDEIYGYSKFYSPPSDIKLTYKFDMYCLGKTLAEFFCNLSNDEVKKLNYKNFNSICNIEYFQNKKMYNLVRNCLKENPEERTALLDFIEPVCNALGLPF